MALGELTPGKAGTAREAHDLRAAALPAGHSALGEAKLRWAECLVQLGRRTEAQALLSQALVVLRASPDADAAAGAREAAQLLEALRTRDETQR